MQARNVTMDRIWGRPVCILDGVTFMLAVTRQRGANRKRYERRVLVRLLDDAHLPRWTQGEHAMCALAHLVLHAKVRVDVVRDLAHGVLGRVRRTRRVTRGGGPSGGTEMRMAA